MTVDQWRPPEPVHPPRFTATAWSAPEPGDSGPLSHCSLSTGHSVQPLRCRAGHADRSLQQVKLANSSGSVGRHDARAHPGAGCGASLAGTPRFRRSDSSATARRGRTSLLGFRGSCWTLAIFRVTGTNSCRKVEQQNSRPQTPRPPLSRASSRTPIWRNSMRVRKMPGQVPHQFAEIDPFFGGEIEGDLLVIELPLDGDQVHLELAGQDFFPADVPEFPFVAAVVVQPGQVLCSGHLHDPLFVGQFPPLRSCRARRS